MKVKFLKEFKGIKNHSTCCFTGRFCTSSITIKESEVLKLVKQPKEPHKPRIYTIYIDNQTLHPDWIPHVECDLIQILD